MKKQGYFQKKKKHRIFLLLEKRKKKTGEWGDDVYAL